MHRARLMALCGGALAAWSLFYPSITSSQPSPSADSITIHCGDANKSGANTITMKCNIHGHGVVDLNATATLTSGKENPPQPMSTIGMNVDGTDCAEPAVDHFTGQSSNEISCFSQQVNDSTVLVRLQYTNARLVPNELKVHLHEQK
jgi:hypothetical protein